MFPIISFALVALRLPSARRHGNRPLQKNVQVKHLHVFVYFELDHKYL